LDPFRFYDYQDRQKANGELENMLLMEARNMTTGPREINRGIWKGENKTTSETGIIREEKGK
jgi:hypothetical protein